MKKILSTVLAFLFVHISLMPSMMSFASEENTCPMQMSEEQMGSMKDMLLTEKNNHHCCTQVTITPFRTVFSSEKKHCVVPPVFLFDKTVQAKEIVHVKLWKHIKNVIPDIFLEHKKYIVMRV